MLELLVVPALTSAASQLVKSLVLGRAVGREDAASVATSVLQAILSTQQQTNDELARLEGKLDRLVLAPYVAGMSAGTRLMGDAAAAHRTSAHRAQMLAEARTQFVLALGHAPDAVRSAQCETYYGLAWLADGSVEDAVLAQGRAARHLEEEAAVTLPEAFDEMTELRRRQADGFTVGVIKGFFARAAGRPAPNSGRADARFSEVLREHRALQRLRVATGWGSAGFPATIANPPSVSQLSPLEVCTALRFTWEPSQAAVPCGALGVVVTSEVTVRDSARQAVVNLTNHREKPLVYSVYLDGPIMFGLSANWQDRLLPSPDGETSAAAFAVPPGQSGSSTHTFEVRGNYVMVNVRLDEHGPFVRFSRGLPVPEYRSALLSDR